MHGPRYLGQLSVIGIAAPAAEGISASLTLQQTLPSPWPVHQAGAWSFRDGEIHGLIERLLFHEDMYIGSKSQGTHDSRLDIREEYLTP